MTFSSYRTIFYKLKEYAVFVTAVPFSFIFSFAIIIKFYSRAMVPVIFEPALVFPVPIAIKQNPKALFTPVLKSSYKNNLFVRLILNPFAFSESIYQNSFEIFWLLGSWN